MAEARGREAWKHTSSVLALIANVYRDPKKHGPFKPSDFDPYRAKEKDVVIPHCDVEVLKQVFIDGKGG
jgi:hypothetical protein